MNQNLAAFLAMLSLSEDTTDAPDPYRVCFKKIHTILDLNYHPAERRPDGSVEWGGEQLPDDECIAVGLSPGCVSTAAGKYQIIRPTWIRLKNTLALTDFTGPSQDDACVQLLKDCKAFDLVNSGQVALAINQCRTEWASLPGNAAKQPKRSLAFLIQAYGDRGGAFA